MSYLEQFSRDEREFLASLPYRTGLWISESDDSGGDDADEAEKNALRALITGYTEDFLKSEFVEELMKATLHYKEKWPEWEKSLDTLPDDCARGLALLEGRLDVNSVLSFRQSLMEIANTVAMAYREFDESQDGTVDVIRMYVRYYKAVITAKIAKAQPPTMDEIFNISHDELQALRSLSQILQVDMQGRARSA